MKCIWILRKMRLKFTTENCVKLTVWYEDHDHLGSNSPYTSERISNIWPDLNAAQDWLKEHFRNWRH